MNLSSNCGAFPQQERGVLSARGPCPALSDFFLMRSELLSLARDECHNPPLPLIFFSFYSDDFSEYKTILDCFPVQPLHFLFLLSLHSKKVSRAQLFPIHSFNGSPIISYSPDICPDIEVSLELFYL